MWSSCWKCRIQTYHSHGRVVQFTSSVSPSCLPSTSKGGKALSRRSLEFKTNKTKHDSGSSQLTSSPRVSDHYWKSTLKNKKKSCKAWKSRTKSLQHGSKVIAIASWRAKVKPDQLAVTVIDRRGTTGWIGKTATRSVERDWIYPRALRLQGATSPYRKRSRQIFNNRGWWAMHCSFWTRMPFIHSNVPRDWFESEGGKRISGCCGLLGREVLHIHKSSQQSLV